MKFDLKSIIEKFFMNSASIFKPLELSLLRQFLPVIGLSLLLWLSFLVLHEFMLTFAWTFILASVLWVPHQKLTHYFKGNKSLSAGLLTGMVTTIILIFMTVLLHLLQNEIMRAYSLLVTNFNHRTIELPKWIQNLPIIGEYLQTHLNTLLENRVALNEKLLDLAKMGLGETAYFLRSFGQHLIKLGFVLITLFFCFRDGQNWLTQAQLGCTHFFNDKNNVILQTAGNTAQAVVYGLVLAAAGQGVVAGIGYAIAGVNTPVLLGALTAFLALIPMGATLVWLPLSVTLIFNDELLAGFSLLAWGFLAVSMVDNIIRPLVICGAGKTPFLIVLFGIFGGLTAFGAIGLFLGPVILAVLLAVWRDYFQKLATIES
jgi:Ca2+-transporting ATPase